MRSPESVRRQEERSPAPEVSEVERFLMSLMLLDLKYTLLPEDVRDQVFRGGDGAAVYRLLQEQQAEGRTGAPDRNRLRDAMDPDTYEEFIRTEVLTIPEEKEQVLYDQCIDYIRKQLLRQRDQEITWKLSLEDGSVPEEELRKLMLEQAEIQKKLKGGN